LTLGSWTAKTDLDEVPQQREKSGAHPYRSASTILFA
jgi:hypothetical protein